MKKLILLLVAAGSIVAMPGCTRVGPPGPQGPQGPQGNANVIGSDPFTVSLWTWSVSDNAYKATFSSSDITPAIVDRGIVQLFKNYGTTANPSWTPLPDVVNNTVTTFNFYDGGFDIYEYNANGSVPTIPPGASTFRMVVVASALREANPNTNWKDYNAVMAVLKKAAEKNTISE